MIVDRRAGSPHVDRMVMRHVDVVVSFPLAEGCHVSRHPDTATAREDPTLNLTPTVRLCPVVLLHALGTSAASTYAGFNGRAELFLDDFPYLVGPTSSEHTSS
jgi:hypothetical protein